MRGIFGLAGVLIVLGVIVWWLGARGGGLDQTRQTIQVGNKAREQVNQLAGNDPESGERASQSAVLEALTPKAKFSGLLVARVTSGGAYEKYFGLKRNDMIVAAEYQGTRMDMKGSSDLEMAKAWVDEAFRRQGAIYVVRDEKEVKLPAVAPSAGGQSPKRDAMQQQIDALQGIPR